MDRIATDPAFSLSQAEITALLHPMNFVGRAPQQTAEFLDEVVAPILKENNSLITGGSEILV